MTLYPRGLSNPPPEAFALWQNMGAAVVLSGFVVMVRGRFGKSKEEKRHEQIL